MRLKNKVTVISLIAICLCALVGCSSKESESNYKRNATLESKTLSEIIYNSAKESNEDPKKTYSKIAYITIDDGPSQYTDEMVKILKDNGVNATFFMINGNMKEYPQQVKNALEAGNSIGFHSVSHDIHQLYKSTTSAKEEFDVCEKTFQSITGEKSNLIRFPFGSKPYTPQSSYDAIVDAGYRIWDWNLDTEDWKSTSPQIIQNIKTYAKGDEIVVLIHERKQTVAVLDEIIKYLKSQGYEILPITQTQQEQNYWNQKLGSKS